jgi:hypothetical protein
MICQFCGEEMVAGQLHYCPDKPMMLKVSWETLTKIWRWLNGKEKSSRKETKKADGTGRDWREENEEERKVNLL